MEKFVNHNTYVQFKYDPPSYPVSNPNIFYPIGNEGT